ncbi:hypothetical protein [Gordonia soli]|uniref:Uncharacterized protein n=1 Tax=Gordonia soli NBRC 108243 TaxID=1223545 RepID=M0QR12_9ACTN|nr:hypothetical protein [Gordonia soli]GAC71033.1 hypothetical protein GS4_47_00230 [Gordonia soli NBRC 108243]
MLIEALPQDSAVHRARTDGQAWGWSEQLLWMAIRAMEVQTAQLAARSFNPKPRIKVAKQHPRFPWSEQTEEDRHFGSRGDLDSVTVMSVLKSGFDSDAGLLRIEDDEGQAIKEVRT